MYWRYRGDPSMGAWLLHRLTGIGIFAFLLMHIVDTALIGWGEDAYDTVVRLYHHPFFRIGEVLLVGAVLFHGLNGLRVVVLDFAPNTTIYQRQMLFIVLFAFVVSFIPSAVIMVGQMLGHTDALSWNWSGWRDGRAWLPAVVGAFAVAAVSVPSITVSRPLPPAARPVGGLEFHAWAFMRVSGVLLMAIVLGHLFVMHLMDGGVNRVNFEFVARRFATPFWRTYDFIMLTLAMGHGVWGMRIVLLDYIHRPTFRFWSVALLYAVSGIILALGALVLFTFQPLTAGGTAGEARHLLRWLCH